MATASSRTLPGRPHDLLSYSGAILVYVAVTFHRDRPWAALHGSTELALTLWLCHFSRRLAECTWVHRYAGRRVPIADALGEYAYYWGFAAWIASSLHQPSALDLTACVGIALFAVGETGNAWAHLKLRALRRPNTQDRGIPTGGLFELVSCANYTYEIVAWAGFALVARKLSAAIYLLGVVLVLASWAQKRQLRYRRTFDGREGRPLYPEQRKALVPWIFFTP